MIMLMAIGFSTEVIKVIDPILKILMALTSIALIVIVMLQDGNTDNITGLTSGSNDSFYNKTKAQTKESKLKKATLGLGAVLLVLSVLYFVFQLQ